jgi:hypothetical protein
MTQNATGEKYNNGINPTHYSTIDMNGLASNTNTTWTTTNTGNPIVTTTTGPNPLTTTIGGRYNPTYIDGNNTLIGRRSDTALDQGYVYAPYIPFDAGITIGGHGSFTHSVPIWNSFVEKFSCYPSSEGRIRPGKKEIIFKLLQNTALEYVALVKHLAIEETLFNTIMMEFALEYAPKRYMQLLATNPHFTKTDLFNQVIKIY